MLFKKSVFISLLFVLLMPSVVLADGMIMPPPERYIWETEQKAVIFYEKPKETLILSVSFQGNAEDFAWIVPSPSRPQVSKSSDELFISLAELTEPKVVYQRAGLVGDYGLDKVQSPGVVVLETKQIDYYEIAVLEASNANALSDWLNDNGYQYPESGRYILDSYISNNWYFTAIKINDEYLSDNIGDQLKSGHAIPLRLDFMTDKIVYPLKISSIQAQSNLRSRYYYPNRKMGILLYVFTDSKQELPKFDTQYAGWLEKDVIEELAFDDNGNAWLTPKNNKYFLTRLYRSMTKAEMTSDLYLRQADDNETVNVPEEKQERGWTRFVILMVVAGLVMLILLFILMRSEMKK